MNKFIESKLHDFCMKLVKSLSCYLNHCVFNQLKWSIQFMSSLTSLMPWIMPAEWHTLITNPISRQPMVYPLYNSEFWMLSFTSLMELEHSSGIIFSVRASSLSFIWSVLSVFLHSSLASHLSVSFSLISCIIILKTIEVLSSSILQSILRWLGMAFHIWLLGRPSWHLWVFTGIRKRKDHKWDFGVRCHVLAIFWDFSLQISWHKRSNADGK